MISNEKSTTVRYCPVVGHNVFVEFTYSGDFGTGKNISNYSDCLNSHKCLKDRGGCTNKIFHCCS